MPTDMYESSTWWLSFINLLVEHVQYRGWHNASGLQRLVTKTWINAAQEKYNVDHICYLKYSGNLTEKVKKK